MRHSFSFYSLVMKFKMKLTLLRIQVMAHLQFVITYPKVCLSFILSFFFSLYLSIIHLNIELSHFTSTCTVRGQTWSSSVCFNCCHRSCHGKSKSRTVGRYGSYLQFLKYGNFYLNFITQGSWWLRFVWTKAMRTRIHGRKLSQSLVSEVK